MKLIDNNYLVFVTLHQGVPYKTKDGIMFVVEARGSLTKMSVIDILNINVTKDSCVSVDSVKNLYHMVFLPPDILHRSDYFYYEAPVDWGVFAISISSQRKNCIDNIVIRGFSDDSEKRDEIKSRKASLRGEFDQYKKALGVQ